MQNRLIRGLGVTGLPLLIAAGAAWLSPDVTAQMSIDVDDIGGVVRSNSGPEAGVWVIAETDGLDTRFRKIVVTDDQGRYVVPDLPTAEYQLWVRGYGLAASTPVRGRPGATVALRASAAASPKEAAEVYPAN